MHATSRELHRNPHARMGWRAHRFAAMAKPRLALVREEHDARCLAVDAARNKQKARRGQDEGESYGRERG